MYKIITDSLAQLIILLLILRRCRVRNMAGISTILTEIYRDFPYSSVVDKAPPVSATLEAVGFRGPRRTEFCRV
jgi:hypothetical protein